MTGDGLHQVRQRVQKAFEDARHEPVTTPSAPKAARPLCELVVPLIKVAARRFNAAPYARHQETHLIVVPKESAGRTLRGVRTRGIEIGHSNKPLIHVTFELTLQRDDASTSEMSTSETGSNEGFVKAEEIQLKDHAEHLVASGKMPSLEQLTAAILESRRKYAAQIRMARREAKSDD